MGRRGWTRGAAGTAILLVGLAFVSRVSTAGDPELAKFLLQGGRDDYAKKNYDDALKKLSKATKEDPGLIEASYWAGQVHEAKKDTRMALVSYRAFRDAYDEKKAKQATTKEEDAISAKVQARFDALAASENEFRKIQTGYASQLFAFAQENFVRDPAITMKALQMLLEVQPTHEAAKKLLERLGKPAAEGAAAADPSGVKAWVDLIATTAYDPAHGIDYGEGTLAFENRKGAMVTPGKREKTGTRYVVEAEARFVESFDETSAFGVGVGSVKDEVLMVMVAMDKVDLLRVRFTGQGPSRLARKEFEKPIEVDQWTRVTIAVDVMRVEVRLDGAIVLEKAVEAEGRDDLQGEVGIYAQQCRVEYRRLRIGARE